MKKNNSKHFAICIKNNGYKVSLERRKIYPVLDDKEASAQDLIRVIDESGEDYLYAASRFVIVNIPEKSRGRLLRARNETPVAGGWVKVRHSKAGPARIE